MVKLVWPDYRVCSKLVIPRLTAHYAGCKFLNLLAVKNRNKLDAKHYKVFMSVCLELRHRVLWPHPAVRLAQRQNAQQQLVNANQ